MCFSLAQPLSTVCAIILLLATLTNREADARLPPKLLKAASAASKALYARGYGYSVIPIPQKILLQTNVARREIHHPRPPRRTKRPRRGKRPPSAYASKYHDYRPSRKRRPPPIRDPPDYEEQQELEEDFDYDDRNYKEFDDFVPKHSELYSEGNKARRKPQRQKYKDEEGAYAEHSRPVYLKRRPNIKSWPGSRPSSKLYSSSISLPPRYHQDEGEEDEEEVGFREYFRGNKNRGRYRDNGDDDDRRFAEEAYDEGDDESPYYSGRFSYLNPDDYYHDRKYQIGHEYARIPTETKPNIPRKSDIERNRKRTPQLNRGKIKEDHKQEWPEVKDSNWTPQSQIVNSYDKKRWQSGINDDKWGSHIPPAIYSTPVRSESSRDTNQGKWFDFRSPPGSSQWKQAQKPQKEEWNEPEIITKQNAEIWEHKRPLAIGSFRKEPKEYPNTWIKEHSVGYGIEIEGGQKKKRIENADPDVVYGQSGNSKPRIPDLGYGQGMELVDDAFTRRQTFIR